MKKNKVKKHLNRVQLIRKAADIIPFFLVSIAFFINLFSGIFLGIELITIMIRSIISVLLFSIAGYFISKNLKAIARTIEKGGAKGRAKKPSAKKIIDVASEPDDSDLLKEMRETEDDFVEARPSDFTGSSK